MQPHGQQGRLSRRGSGPPGGRLLARLASFSHTPARAFSSRCPERHSKCFFGGCPHPHLRTGARRAASLGLPDALSRAEGKTVAALRSFLRTKTAARVGAPPGAAGIPALLPQKRAQKRPFAAQPAAAQAGRAAAANLRNFCE